MAKKTLSSFLNMPAAVPVSEPAITAVERPQPAVVRIGRLRGRPATIAKDAHKILVPLEDANSYILEQAIRLKIDGATSQREAINAMIAAYGKAHPQLLPPIE